MENENKIIQAINVINNEAGYNRAEEYHNFILLNDREGNVEFSGIYHREQFLKEFGGML